MRSVRKANPSFSICAFTGFNTFSSSAQTGQRLSNQPSSPLSVTSSMLNTRVRGPEISSSMAMPNASPLTSPWGEAALQLL